MRGQLKALVGSERMTEVPRVDVTLDDPCHVRAHGALWPSTRRIHDDPPVQELVPGEIALVRLTERGELLLREDPLRNEGCGEVHDEKYNRSELLDGLAHLLHQRVLIAGVGAHRHDDRGLLV